MKVLCLTQGPEAAPSSRYRVYQLLPHLQRLGLECVVSPALDDTQYRRIYRDGGSRLSAFNTIRRQRHHDLRRLDEFNVVFIQKGIFPGLTASLETRIAKHKPVVFDFDDAIWLPRQGGHPLLRALHRESPVQQILRQSTAVIAGNEFLANYARPFCPHVTIIPSAVDPARYQPTTGTNTVGWIGSPTTLPYLKPLAPVFRELQITPRVIAAGDPRCLGFPVEFRHWQMETEVAELTQIGIGLAPLPDTPWERGKCGVKILQYMAAGIPVIATPVGVQADLVRDGQTGFLVTTLAQWRDRLRQLRADAALRQRLGATGRALVDERYDLVVAAARVAEILKASAQT
jgi:glycosyltransferase involved in cell wall biosynthesis